MLFLKAEVFCFSFFEQVQVSCEELLHLVDKYRCSVGEDAMKAHLSSLPITSHGKSEVQKSYLRRNMVLSTKEQLRKGFSNADKKKQFCTVCLFRFVLQSKLLLSLRRGVREIKSITSVNINLG